jgi:uncharacterized protein
VEDLDLPDGHLLLANLLWRTFVELSSREAEAWKALGGQRSFPGRLPDDLLGRLREGKMLLDSSLDELGFIAERYRRSRFAPVGLGLTIAPTLDCNLACVYCYESKRVGRMSREVEKAILNYVERELPGRKALSVTWYGGEPLMCQETICRLTEAFLRIAESAAATYDAHVITNGYLLTPAVADRLEQLGHWRGIQVSIDGNAASHNVKRPTKAGGPTFERIVANLDSAARRLPVTVRVNVDLLNPQSCHQLLEQLVDMRLAPHVRVYFAPIHPFGKGCRDIAERESVKVCTNPEFAGIEVGLVCRATQLGFKTRPAFEGPWLQQCQAVSTHSVVVEPDGGLQRCWIEVGEDDKRVGHIAQPLEITSRNNMRWLRFDPTRIDRCRDCRALPVCMGGCPKRHVDGAPEEFLCNQIRYNLKEIMALEYLAKHRPECLPKLGQQLGVV